MAKRKGLFVMNAGLFSTVYGPEEQAEIREHVDIYAPPQTADSLRNNPALLAEVEVIFSGWGAPALDDALLAAAPRLQAFFYAAGALGGIVGAEAMRRGIVLVSAANANAVPVAEYTVASIVYGLKQAFRFQREVHATQAYPKNRHQVAGAYGSTVGLVSLGAIGKLVRERMASFLDVNVIAYDPFTSPKEAQALSIELVSLEEVFRRSDVVSLHTPWLPETERLIRGSHIAAMKHGASLINTARGAIIAEDEMTEVLSARPDLTAILDVCHPEPPPPGSPLYTLPNIFLTPHIAGSLDAECRRMARYIVDDMHRWLQGEPLLWQIRPEAAWNTSHRPKSLPTS